MRCEWPQLERCCLCLPLRRGVLALGYVTILFCAFAVGVNSYIINKRDVNYYERETNFTAEITIAMSLIEIVFAGFLVYGAHTKTALYVKVFYYFALMWTLAAAVFQLLTPLRRGGEFIIEGVVVALAYLCIQLYLIALVRSLLMRLQTRRRHGYDNQLADTLDPDTEEEKGVYNNTTAPVVI